MVERIECIHPKLRCETFRDLQCFKQAGVYLLQAVRVQWVNAGIAVGVRNQIIRKATCVKPLVHVWI